MKNSDNKQVNPSETHSKELSQLGWIILIGTLLTLALVLLLPHGRREITQKQGLDRCKQDKANQDCK